MGAIRTKLETFKQPRTIKSTGHVSRQNFGPKGGGAGKGLDYSKAFWMARALHKDEQTALDQQMMGDAMATKRMGRMDNLQGLTSQVDAMIQNLDQLIASLPTE